ncbi:MAG: hypothetical protein ACM3NI_10845 [Bacteroidota bacterium]
MNFNSVTRILQLVVFLSVLNMLTTAALFAQVNTDRHSFYPSMGVEETMDRTYQLNPY